MRDLPAGVKETTGGAFDPEAPTQYFIASNPSQMLRVPHEYVLVAVNELDTPKQRETLDRILDTGKKVFLDSGIFNLAMSHARKHDVSHDVGLSMPPEEIDGFSELWDLYGTIATTYADRIWGIVELDQGGVEHKPRTRARIEDEFGITPIPVYHPLLDGWTYYDDLAREYDRICFGNIVKASPPLRLRLAHTAYERGRQYPYLWTHLLGMTPNQNVLSMRMRGSLDSSSWLAPARWPHSWRTPAMLKALAPMPPTMWAHSGTDSDNYDRDKLEDVCGTQAAALQMTFDHTTLDTHPAAESPA